MASRGRETQPLDLHDELDGIARFLAAKTMKKAAIGMHVERRGLLTVKGAKSFEARTGAFQRDELADHRDDIRSVPNLGYLLIRNQRKRSPDPFTLCLPRRIWLRSVSIGDRKFNPFLSRPCFAAGQG